MPNHFAANSGLDRTGLERTASTFNYEWDTIQSGQLVPRQRTARPTQDETCSLRKSWAVSERRNRFRRIHHQSAGTVADATALA